MRHAIVACLVLFACAISASAQPYALSPLPIQFFDTNGVPVSGGLLYTCQSGSTCPGTPQTAYTDSSGFTALPNPIILSASGYVQGSSGGVTGVWLNSQLAYKFVLQTSAAVTIWSIDNVTVQPGPYSGSNTNYWTLSGSTISNNNASGSGPVSIGGQLSVANNIVLTGNLQLRDAQSSPNYAIIQGANCIGTLSGSTCTGANYTWRWPGSDAAGVLTSDGAGNLSFQPGGGGGGSAAGGAGAVQLSNGSGVFVANTNLSFNTSTQSLIINSASTADAGVIVTTGGVQADYGFNAVNNLTPSTPLGYNIIQASTGGMYALSFTAKNYIESGSSAGAPSATTGDSSYPRAGTLYCDTTSSPCTEKLWNGSAWVSLASGGATPPGGSNGNVQFNSSGVFGGTTNLQWVTGAAPYLQITGASSSNTALSIVGTFAQSDYGFLANPLTATGYNVIQAPAGGMQAKSFNAVNYIKTGTTSSNPPPLTASDPVGFTFGTMFFDQNLGYEEVCSQLSCSSTSDGTGTGWVSLGPTGGGGTGCSLTGTANTQVLFNASGACAGSNNFEWSNSGQALQITGISSTTALRILNGYASVDGGYATTATNYNALNAASGGAAVRSVTATAYVKTGYSSVTPTLSSGDSGFTYGSMYYNTAVGAEQVCTLSTCTGGTGWLSLGTSAVSSVNGATGAIAINGTANQVDVSTIGSTITLSTPQPIATFSSPTFASLTAQTYTSSASGATNGFALSNGNFTLNGNGAAYFASSAVNAIYVPNGYVEPQGLTALSSAGNSVQTVGGFRADDTGGSAVVLSYGSGGAALINSSGQWVGKDVLATGNVAASGVFAVGPAGGPYSFGITHTVTIGSCSEFFTGGILYATSGC